MKSIIAALLVTVATPAICLATQDSEVATAETTEMATSSPEVDEMMAMFSKMFDTSNLPPPEPARLKLAETASAKLLPDGTYVKIINDMMGQILTPMFNIMPGLSDDQLVSATGASAEVVGTLTEADKAAVTQLIDPYHKQRGEQVVGAIKPVIAEAMAIIEPAMRTGLTRAYARKFTTAELGSINGFFATPTGASFARESFAMQADPEVMQAMFKSLPTIFERFTGQEAKFKAKFDELPKQRSMADMSDAELQKLSQILGLTVESLKNYEAMAMTDTSLPECALDGDDSDCTDADWVASDAAAAAVEAAAAAVDTAAIEAETRKQRSAWSKADLKTVEQAEAAQVELWARHDKIDVEMADAELRLQSAIDTAKRNAGQPVEEEHHDGADGMTVAAL